MALGVVTAQTAAPVRCAACVTLVVEPGQTVALPGPMEGLPTAVRARPGSLETSAPALAAIRNAGGVPALLVTEVPAVPLDARVVAQAAQVFLDVSAEQADTDAAFDELAFRLKLRLTELRALSPALELGVVGRDDQRGRLRARDVGPYLDIFAQRVPPGAPRPAWPRAGEPYAFASRLDDDAKQDAREMDAARWLWTAPADVLDASALARDLATARQFLVADLLPGGTVDVSCDGKPVPTYLNPATLETVAFALSCAAGRIDARTSTPAQRIALSTGDTIVRVPAAEGQFSDDVKVTGTRELRVEEIVARHQAAAARQRAAVRTLISTGSMTLTFEAPGFPAPVAIGSETVVYESQGRTDLEQRSIRVNGIEFKGGGVPRLPIIEPERVASPPLAIALSDAYRYRLAGRDRVGGADCYVVAFEPLDASRALFRGRAWIHAETFAMTRVAAAQTGLRGAIVSSEQVDEFERNAGGLWLLARSEVRQMYEGAGHRTPIHRVLAVRAHEVNAPDFDARRAAAYASDSVMLRDTPAGFRYLRRERSADSSRPVEPVVSEAAARVRTLAVGVIVDPNISRPLPFAGLSYVDFDLFRTGTQVNAFFGGTYGQLAFSVPSIAGTRWQLAGRAFGIASSYNDRAFADGREIYERNIRQRPAHASTWVLKPLSPRLMLRGGYELDYTQFGGSDLTSPAFTVPADQVAHSVRLALDGQRAGWSASLWWAGSKRSGWRAWGRGPEDYRAGQADYQRYGATLTRPVVLTPSLVGRIEAAWMSGRDLDRFSRYAFGTFDNRLRGYPSALVRYDRGAVVRTAAAWAAGRRLRVDGFFDSAYVHDPGFGPRLRRYLGTGAALEAPAPFGMLAAVEWGYGFQGVNASGRRGTQVVRVSAFKLF